MDAQQLVERVVKQFAENGIELKERFGEWVSEFEYKTGERRFQVGQVYRHNGTEENVTSRISVYEIGAVWGDSSCSLKEIAKIQVPKDASDKVIANRVKKAIVAFETGEPTR